MPSCLYNILRIIAQCYLNEVFLYIMAELLAVASEGRSADLVSD